MTDRIEGLEDRMARLEAFADNNFRTLATAHRRQAFQRAADESELLTRRVAPGSLSTIVSPLATSAHPSPSGLLDQPLIARLRGDAALGVSIAGASQPYVGMANVLLDPTFETAPLSPTVTIGAVDTAIGTWWMAKHANLVGTAPNQRDAARLYNRIDVDQNIFSSATLQLHYNWNAGGVVGSETLYLYPNGWDPAGTPSVPLPQPWVAAAVRLFKSAITQGDLTVTIYLEIVNSATGIEIVTSDPLDWGDVDKYESASLEVATDSLSEAEYQWRLRIDMERTSTLQAAVFIDVAEPQLGPSVFEGPMPYQPQLGAWVPQPTFDNGQGYLQHALTMGIGQAGVQTGRTTVGGSIAPGASRTDTITLPTAYADANYTVVVTPRQNTFATDHCTCSLEGTPTATDFTVRTVNRDSVARTPVLYWTTVHD